MTCAACGSDFEPTHHLQKHCSPTCRNRHRQRRWRQRHPEQHSQQAKQNIRNLRLRVIAFLGGQCSNTACNFADVRALQIDHVNGDGWKDKLDNKNNARRLYNAVFTEPERYQLLCANCNWIKRAEFNETCAVRFRAADM